MDASWIDAVSDLWKNDAPIDFLKLEKEHQLKPLETQGIIPPPDDGSEPSRKSLLICLTGFHQEARTEIAEKVVSNGGRHTDGLMRSCTHLIVYKPEGKKYAAAKQWGVSTVTVEWLDQSIARGMILDETKYDPLLPPEEIGVGAWTKRDTRRISLGKRSRSTAGEGEMGTRKLRKTASMKLSSQRQNLWGDILGRADSRQYSFAKEAEAESPAPHNETRPEPEPTLPVVPQQEKGIFSDCIFYISGFNTQRTNVLSQTIIGYDGLIASTMYEANNNPRAYHFLIVPQSSQPDTHPEVPDDNTHVVTEFYIEKCIHNRYFFSPQEPSPLGRPFPLFPIPGFEDMRICTAAFSGIELSQVARSVKQLGATFEEQFRKTTSVLVCKSLEATRKEKLKAAVAWKVPVVSADWLWECIVTGYNVPLDDFIYAEVKAMAKSQIPSEPESKDPRQGQRATSDFAPEEASSTSRNGKQPLAYPDPTAFGRDTAQDAPKNGKLTKQDTNISADFQTARTRPAPTTTDPSLTELSSASLNKSPSPPKAVTTQPSRSKSEPAKQPEEEDSSKEDKETLRRAAKAAERQALTSKLTNLLDTTPSHPEQEEPKPRQRKIMGRAISNVSAGSSAASAPPRAASEQQEDEQEPPRTQIGYDDPEAQGYKAALMDKMMGGSGDVGRRRGASVGVGGLGGRSMRKR